MMQLTEARIPLVLFQYNRFGIWYDWFAFVPLIPLTVPALVFKTHEFIVNRTISEHRRRAIEIDLVNSTTATPLNHIAGGNHDDNDGPG